MSCAQDYLTELYAEHGAHWEGDDRKAARVLAACTGAKFHEPEPEDEPEPLPTSEELYAKVREAIKGKVFHALKVANCLPYLSNPLATTREDACGVSGVVEYDADAIGLFDGMEVQIELARLGGMRA